MPFINEVLEANRQQNQLEKEVRSLSGLRSRFAFDPEKIRAELEHNIVGQRDVINAVCQQLKVIKAGLHDNQRPLCVMLFVGDTGVGKTELVRTLARCIHGDTHHSLCRIDMNTLSQSHYSAAITGAPPGYVGSKENATLLNEDAIIGSSSRPGVVLFDEVEKASNDVARSLMNILDSGKMRLASGNRELSFCNSLIFMTSNVGSKQWALAQRDTLRGSVKRWQMKLLGRMPERRKLIDDALHAQFDPEFINRIDRIELFEPLSERHLESIVTLELNKLNNRLFRQGITIELDASALAYLREKGFDPLFGARSIKRAVRDDLMVPLAEALLALDSEQLPVQQAPTAMSTVTLVGYCKDQQVEFKLKSDKE